MDIILGTIGAFFFLLIIVSASRRGIIQEGTELPPNLMILTVKEPTVLKIGESIHYFVAQLKDGDPYEIEKIFYSDADIDGQDRLVDARGSLANPMIMAENDPPPKIIVGVWLQDVFASANSGELRTDQIIINIKCKMIIEVDRPNGFEITLEKGHNYFVACLLNDAESLDIQVVSRLQYAGQPLVRAGVPCRSANEQWKPIQSIADKPIHESIGIPERGVSVRVRNDRHYGERDYHYRNFFEEVGYLILNKREVDFRFVKGFNSPKDRGKDPRDAIIEFFKDNPSLENQPITYVAVGERAVCAVLSDGSLLFQGTHRKELSYYPFKDYLTGKIGTIPENVTDKITTKMKAVEPALEEYTEAQWLQILAEIIAGPSDRKKPYPAFRQNPLLLLD